jgi:hypothetical protein
MWREIDEAAEEKRALELLTRLGECLGFEVHAGKHNGQERMKRTEQDGQEWVKRTERWEGRAGEEPFDLEWWETRVVPGSSAGTVPETRVREVAWRFVWRTRARFIDLLGVKPLPARGLLVLPERLTVLMKEKTRRNNPRWRAFQENGWDFLRLRFIEELLGFAEADVRYWRTVIGIAPEWEKGREQLQLF